jgi:hypothetical protein
LYERHPRDPFPREQSKYHDCGDLEQMQDQKKEDGEYITSPWVCGWPDSIDLGRVGRDDHLLPIIPESNPRGGHVGLAPNERGLTNGLEAENRLPDSAKGLRTNNNLINGLSSSTTNPAVPRKRASWWRRRRWKRTLGVLERMASEPLPSHEPTRGGERHPRVRKGEIPPGPSLG